jgi:hypothetical protein
MLARFAIYCYPLPVTKTTFMFPTIITRRACVIAICCPILLLPSCKSNSINSRVAREFYTAPIVKKAGSVTVSLPEAEIKRRVAEINSLSDTNLQFLQRNDLVYEMMGASDDNFSDFKTRAFTRNASLNSGIDFASLGLSAAATIVGGPAAQAMSAADTGIKGVQAKVSERFLLSQTMVLLITTMESRRAETRTLLYDGLKTNYHAFPAQAGVNLTKEYNNRGNLVDAMAHLQSTMGNQRATNELNASAAQSK